MTRDSLAARACEPPPPTGRPGAGPGSATTAKTDEPVRRARRTLVRTVLTEMDSAAATWIVDICTVGSRTTTVSRRHEVDVLAEAVLGEERVIRTAVSGKSLCLDV